MANSVGQINFGVGIDASGIAAELNAALVPALARVQQRLNRNPIKVPIEIDTAAAITAARAALGRANFKIDVKLDLKITAAQRAALQEIRDLSDKTVNVRFNTNLSADQIRQMRAAATAINRLESRAVRLDFSSNISAEQIARIRQAASAVRRLEDRSVAVNVVTNLSEDDVRMLRSVASAIRRLSDRNVTVRVDLQVDEAQLRRVAELIRSLRDQNVNVRVNSNAETIAGHVRSLNRELGYMPGLAAGIAGVTAALAAIVGAAGAAAGAVGGLVVGLAAVGPAAAAIGATAAVGLEGVGDAFSALSDLSSNAAADARTQSEAVASAQEAMASAADSAESAQIALNDAQESAADAAKGVADAYKTAQERLDNYQTTLKEASLDEREAALNLKEAQEALNKGQLDPTERERALLRVERAEINLAKAQKANKDLNDEAREAQEKGIDQADEVVAARKNQAKADQQVVQSQKALAAANRAVAKAAEDLAKAQSGAGTSSEKFADALARLSPNAQAFVLALRDLQPQLAEFRKGIQDRVFAGLADQLRETTDVLLPLFAANMGLVADELNLATQNFFEFLRSAKGIEGLNASFEGGVLLLRGLRSGTGEFSQGLVDLAATAAPRMEEIGRSFAAIGEGIGRALTEASQDGTLDTLLVGFSDVLTSIGPLLEGVLGSLITMGSRVLPALAPLFETLGQALEDIGPSLGDIGAIFAESLTDILPTLADLITALANGLKPVLPVIASLLKSIGVAIQPLIEPFSRIAVIVGETLVKTLDNLAPALEPLATAFADFLEAIAPVLPFIANNLSKVIESLAPALSRVFDALGPVIQLFTEQMAPVIEDLAPVLADVAGILGQALADAITDIAPVLPDLVASFADFLRAIIPLLPELARMAATVIPSLVEVLVEVAPLVIDMIDAFTLLVDLTLPAVSAALEGFGLFWSDQFQSLADVVRLFGEIWTNTFDGVGIVVDFVTDTVFPKIGEALNSVKGFFADAVEAIGNTWSGLMDKAAIPVNFVIETVWNNGLLKAWGSIDNLLGGVLPDASPLATIPRRATGGPIGFAHGPGNGTKDDILTWMSNGEHVVTAAEVLAAGGQNVLFAIRDMIHRGIPFTWDNGKIVTDLGRDNLSAYGAKVSMAGFGNVAPEGLFDQLANVPIPKFATGGQIMPWMYQLQKGHDFARAQNGKPYQWAGPRFVNDSFDCSGFMGAIAAAILGDNPWQRYWATGSFNGQQVGPQGFTRNLFEGSGFGIGVSNGGPGGGHTAGELRGIPELNIGAARVESGGALGDVHYGRGTDPNSFQMLYGLPIGANGFFQPSPGGSANGPSTSEQSSLLTRTIERIIKSATDPVRDLITSTIGVPPPSVRGIPLGVLSANEKAFAGVASSAVGSLGGLLGGAWQKAQDLGDRVLDFVNPFDHGGIATGTGFLPKNVIAPERVLSPEQTALFEALVAALQKIASAGLGAAGQAASTVIVDISAASVEALQGTLSTPVTTDEAASADLVALQERIDAAFTETGELVSDTVAQFQRSETSTAEAQATVAKQQTDMLLSIAGKLSQDVLGPILSSAVNAGTTFLTDVIDGLSKDVVTAVNGTTRAVNGIASQSTGTSGGPAPAFGAPGSAFDAGSAIVSAVTSVANAATQAFQKVASDVTNAALRQTPSRVGNQSRGTLGEDDISGGFLVDTIVKLTGVEIEILDLLENTYEAIQSFRDGAFTGFDESGQLISDTAAMVQRNQSSIELAAKEQERIQKALIKAVLKYLIVNVLIPIITAVLGAMITLVSVAIGAAIGAAIPVIGPLIGAVVGAVIGSALSGLAAVFTGLLAVGAGAALDAFDEGGVAGGIGFMPKNTIAPERVLSPRQTESFEKLVQVLDRGSTGNRTVQIGSMTVTGRDPAQKTADNLLSLLNT